MPLLILIIRRTSIKSPLFYFSMYWAMTGLINMMQKSSWINQPLIEKVTVFFNMMDIPLVLFILYNATEVNRIKQWIKFASPALLGVQLINFLIQGWNYQAATYVLGLSLITILVVLFWEVYHYMSKLYHSDYQNAMIFMHASLLFAYGSFVIVYIFDYCIKIGSPMDTYLIYYISTIIALMISLWGFTYNHKKQKTEWEILPRQY